MCMISIWTICSIYSDVIQIFGLCSYTYWFFYWCWWGRADMEGFACEVDAVTAPVVTLECFEKRKVKIKIKSLFKV